MSKQLFSFITLFIFLLLCSVFYYSVSYKQQQVQKLNIATIEKQVALDLPLLELSNELLKYSSNIDNINSYLEQLNSQLIGTNLLLLNIVADKKLSTTLTGAQFFTRLTTSIGPVFLVFDIKPQPWPWRYIYYYVAIFMLSAFVSHWLKTVITIEQKSKQLATLQPEPVEESKSPVLVINLNTKTVSVNINPQYQVCLANKPLSFYLALIEFCNSNSDVVLSHNKDVPDELIELANKYFYRLVELGHTIRKRPNFNNSLEKTLSEIRAALDEVLSEYPQQKEIFYPPKAFGEGSRSRLHSYGLVNIAKGDVEIVGK